VVDIVDVVDILDLEDDDLTEGWSDEMVAEFDDWMESR